MQILLTTLVANLTKQTTISVLIMLPAVVLTALNSGVKHQGFNAVLESSDPPLQVQQVSITNQTSYSLNQATAAMAAFLGPVSRTAKYQVETYLLSFKVELSSGNMSPMVAEMFVPAQVNQPLPVIIYAPGTTGLDNKCAPSREYPSYPRLGNYENQMVAMAAQGFIVVMPNYIGLDNPEMYHEYFIKDNEARSLLGTILAMQKIADTLPKYEGIFVGGYSQGGHAAFSAVDLAPMLTPGLEIAGVFGHGPTTDTQTLLLRNPNLSPYFAYTYQNKYEDFDSSQIFLPEKLFQVDRAPSQCVNQAHAFNSANITNTYTEAFGNALLADSLKTEFPLIYRRLADQDAGVNYLVTPTLILQGTGDPIVTLEDQVVFADSLCERDIPVEMKTYPYVHHFQTRQKSFWDTLEWIEAISQGELSATYCI